MCACSLIARCFFLICCRLAELLVEGCSSGCVQCLATYGHGECLLEVSLASGPEADLRLRSRWRRSGHVTSACHHRPGLSFGVGSFLSDSLHATNESLQVTLKTLRSDTVVTCYRPQPLATSSAAWLDSAAISAFAHPLAPPASNAFCLLRGPYLWRAFDRGTSAEGGIQLLTTIAVAKTCQTRRSRHKRPLETSCCAHHC